MPVSQPEYKSVILITENFSIYTPKKYSRLRKFLWKHFFDVEIKDL